MGDVPAVHGGVHVEVRILGNAVSVSCFISLGYIAIHDPEIFDLTYKNCG